MSQTIFMIHGMTAGGWIWENYRKFFENKGYTCITPTLRHHAGDPKAIPDPALGTTSILDYVDDLEKTSKNSRWNLVGKRLLSMSMDG